MTDFDCRSCRDWTGCVGKDSFDYAEIVFCIHQMYWLIKHRETLKDGEWPSETDDNKGSLQISHEASFTKAILIISEVEERLKQAYPYSEHLIDVIDAGVEIQNLSRNPRDVLYYISGWPRKEMTFNKWRWQRDRRRHEDKISSKSMKVGT